jgi:isoaspartyl peptidase/L-asparaginase-like protein (Ntn-hydrolase superfamily)
MARRQRNGSEVPPPCLTGTGFTLAVHGGAGTIPREPSLSATASYHGGLRRALTAGRNVLAASGNALDAVIEAVAALEDDPLFNAGRGSVFTRAGTQEMDASAMEGTHRRAGAVAGVLGPRNPVRAARAVMERSRHVLLIAKAPPSAGNEVSRSASPSISARRRAGRNCSARSKIRTKQPHNTARWVQSRAIAAAFSPPPPPPGE